MQEESRYRLVFNGQIAHHRNPADVKKNVCALLKIDAALVPRVFSGKKVILKVGLSREEVLKHQDFFNQSGALSIIEPEETVCQATITCPKCGGTQEPSASCLHCGVVFAKYQEVLARHEEDYSKLQPSYA